MRPRLIAALCLAGVLISLSPAHAWELWRHMDGRLAYRPADGSGTPPSPGVAPMALEVNYDLSNAPGGIEDDIISAMAVWNSVEGATISLQDAGDTDCCQNGHDCWCLDGQNTVAWITNNWPWDPEALAVTFWEDWDNSTGAVFETDMQINGQDFEWSIGREPRPTEYDLQSVIVHEMGHFCMFYDLFDFHFSQSTMFGYLSEGSIRARTLDQDDIEGLRFMYPASESDLPPPHVIGFIKSGDSSTYDKLIEYEGTDLTSVTLKGFGFIETDSSVENFLDIEVWQSGAPVVSPEVTLAQFVDYDELTVDVDFSASTGEYDLVIINPNGKADLDAGAIQVNLTGNTAPTVDADDDSEAEYDVNHTVCATATDPNDDGDGNAPLIYSWELVVQPEESAAALEDVDRECTSFTPDKNGYYLLEVTVSDGIVTSYADATLVTAGGEPYDYGGGGGCGCNVSPSASSTYRMPIDTAIVILLPLLLALLKKRRATPPDKKISINSRRFTIVGGKITDRPIISELRTRQRKVNSTWPL